MKILDGLAKILLVVAGLNWGMVGIANFNLIMWAFNTMPMVQQVIYIAFGLAGIWTIFRALGK